MLKAACLRTQSLTLSRNLTRSSFQSFNFNFKFIQRARFSTETLNELKNVKYETNNKVAIIRFDCAGSKVNTLSKDFMLETKQCFNKAQTDPEVDSIVFISSKPDGFISGADINMIEECTSPNQVQELAKEGQFFLNEIAGSKKPVVAAINGNCLGGGLELALACHYRIGSENKQTILGFPEIQLGLIPGAGGTQRLPPLVGILDSLDMILTGKRIQAPKAVKMGLIDSIIDPKGLENAAISAAKQLAGKSLKVNRKLSFLKRLLFVSPISTFIFYQARQRVMRETYGNYPAPISAIEVIKTGINSGFGPGSHLEALQFGILSASKQSKALRHLFFTSTSTKKNHVGAPKNPPSTLGVLGAGLMGAGIAQVSIERNFNVILYDRDNKGLFRGINQITKNFNSKVKRKSMLEAERERTLAKITGISGEENNTADKYWNKMDVLVEAIPEDIKLKHRVLSDLESKIRKDCIIASNTSAIPIVEIAAGVSDPSRVVGLHYFSPVDKMQLVEVIKAPQTSNEALSVAVDVSLRQGKFVVVVNDGPGFFTTRVLAAMMLEASLLVEEGVDPHKLEKLTKEFGFPVGPLALMDEVGIDVGHHVSTTMRERFGSRMGNLCGGAEKMIKKGWMGRKSGNGFYNYNKKGKVLNTEAVKLVKVSNDSLNESNANIVDRLALRFINEACLCLEENILLSAADGDVASVFGLGFPPFLGGPFKYIDTIGASIIVKRLLELNVSSKEKRFTPSKLLCEYAEQNKLFYPAKN
eukprot:TRINITY_DN536_c0_g2_i1.p1 TRINITY_DN536_c0_g2~~TRINITY_DN536_c0_g2_i1.p1  ORF type:complete len:758 (-),score=393.72 TRINITY_DN536_c0_g2_i1:58-2331(-)